MRSIDRQWLCRECRCLLSEKRCDLGSDHELVRTTELDPDDAILTPALPPAAVVVLLVLPLVAFAVTVSDDLAFRELWADKSGLGIAFVWSLWGVAMIAYAIRRRAIAMPFPPGLRKLSGVIEASEQIKSASGEPCAVYGVGMAVGGHRPFAFAAQSGELTVRCHDGTRLIIPAGAVRLRSRNLGARFKGEELWETIVPQLAKLDHCTTERVIVAGDEITIYGSFERRVDLDAEQAHQTAYRDPAASMLVATGPVAIDI